MAIQSVVFSHRQIEIDCLKRAEKKEKKRYLPH